MKKEIANYRNVSINPCNMCMPMGGIIALKGVKGSMTILHGSQGCATYMRRSISEHYNEPVDVASSSLNEKGTVYGGEENLKNGLDNVIKVYQPEIIGILTTCLAETIGEDIGRITVEYRQERGLTSLPIITSPTPGYSGTQTEGYWTTLKNIVTTIAKKTPQHSRINVIIPHLSSADIRELKRLLEMMQVDYTLLPDFSDILDGPYDKNYRRVPAGGTPLGDIAAMPGAPATIEFSVTLDDGLSAGVFLQDKYGVPLYRLPLPIGLEYTDKLIQTISVLTGKKAPQALKIERGRLQDGMIDSHKYNFIGRAAIYGDPEQLFALASLCMENGILPKVIATGSKNNKIEEILREQLNNLEESCEVLKDTDFMRIREKCLAHQVNLAIGNSEGRYLTEQEGIPLVRIGFPIHDRVGGQRLLTLGYNGSLTLLDRLTNTLLNQKLSHYRAKLYQKYYFVPNQPI